MLHWASEVIIKSASQDIFDNFVHYSRMAICNYLNLTYSTEDKKRKVNDFEKEYPGPMDTAGTNNSLPRSPVLLYSEAYP